MYTDGSKIGTDIGQQFEYNLKQSWSCLLDGQRRAQLSALPRVEGVACFRIITRQDYLQTHLLKIDLADSPLCPLCKSVPMIGEHISDCPALLHVLSQDNCGVLLPALIAVDFDRRYLGCANSLQISIWYSDVRDVGDLGLKRRA
ncbi:hypothetical protein TNCV_2742811 [Trichonephila clavipes]|nr:hypothetical protein TNCV_2742811 [Trichonephila clavipes]